MPPEQDRPSLSSALLSFIRLESAGGILLLGATVLAMIAANTPPARVAGVRGGGGRRAGRHPATE